MATTTRIRRDIRKLSSTEQDNLIRAFVGIMKLNPQDDNSFFKIAGYHGEPFEKSGKEYEWGGYCFHNAVLFPSWHRAYCLRIEDALRSIEGCGDVTLPYWDEFKDSAIMDPDDNEKPQPIPPIFLQRRWKYADGTEVDNPLFSYKLQKTITDAQGADDRHTKHAGYKTLRFPFSGLVGTLQLQEESDIYNAQFTNPDLDLQKNIYNWLNQGIDLKKFDYVGNADTYSVLERIRKCLDAPNWTAFSNKSSARRWARYQGKDEDIHWVVSIEEPHNAIHLGLGGFFQNGTEKSRGYNANPEQYQNANGDMGANETAAFDPIFFIHHCFIDYLMWAWQKRHGMTEKGSLKIDYDWTFETDPKKDFGPQGTFATLGNAAVDPATWLQMSTPLKPFKKPNSDKAEEFWTADDLTNIADIGYIYEDGSLEDTKLTHSNKTFYPNVAFSSTDSAEKVELAPALEIPLLKVRETPLVKVNKYNGSFVIRTYAHTANGEKVEIGCDPVLSRNNSGLCSNCQDNEYTTGIIAVPQPLAEKFAGEGKKGFKCSIEIQHSQGQERLNGHRPMWDSDGAADEGDMTFEWN